ncbi:MAG: hypothetical protein HY22_00125 [[Candidatus Thermochlorobacteriaceae] bacterium GBChlB]|nr:MAG: hypothetical protein HY22_00125 [[Candidatus Thermochlorobacteriaceae] bacterium GBChlB]
MIKFSLITGIITILFCFSVNAQEIRSKHKTDEQVLRHLKEVLWPKAYREQDTLLLDELLDDKFQMVEANGDYSDKNLEIAYIKKNKPSYTSFNYKIERLDIFKNGTAVITGTGTIKGQNSNGNYTTTYHSSNNFIKVKKKWKAINSHVSGVKTEYEEIKKLLDLYVLGLQKGDLSLLRQAFLSDGQFCILSSDNNIQCQKFSEVLDTWVKSPDPNTNGKILGQEMQGSMAKVTFKLNFSNKVFVDYLTLYKSVNGWTIVAKTTQIQK